MYCVLVGTGIGVGENISKCPPIATAVPPGLLAPGNVGLICEEDAIVLGLLASLTGIAGVELEVTLLAIEAACIAGVCVCGGILCVWG